MIDSAEASASSYPKRAIADVLSLVAREKNVPLHLLMHRSRCRAQASQARHLAMYLSYVVLGRTLSQIGEEFGRDRTTVSYACAQIEDLRDDPLFDAEVSRLEAWLETDGEEAQHAAA
jgi:chromosomal replication initiation ATPase DnaA